MKSWDIYHKGKWQASVTYPSYMDQSQVYLDLVNKKGFDLCIVCRQQAAKSTSQYFGIKKG